MFQITNNQKKKIKLGKERTRIFAYQIYQTTSLLASVWSNKKFQALMIESKLMKTF